MRPGDEAKLLYDTLQFIAVSKRDYHRNHYALTRMLLTHFAIPLEEKHALPGDYRSRLENASPEMRDLCTLVTLLGFLLDGKLSWRERGRITLLNEAGILKESFTEVRHYATAFIDGKGIEPLFQRYLLWP